MATRRRSTALAPVLCALVLGSSPAVDTGILSAAVPCAWAPCPTMWRVSGRARACKCTSTNAVTQGLSGEHSQPGAAPRRRIIPWKALPSQGTPAAGGRQGPSQGQIQLNKRLTRCDSPDAVIVQVHAAEESGLVLTSINVVTAMHRLAKTSAAGSTLRREDALLLLARVDRELAAASRSALNDRALTTLAWSLGSLYHTLSDVRVSDEGAQRAGLLEHVRGTLRNVVSQLRSRSLSQIPSQGLSNVAWSCAKCDLQDDVTAQLLDRIAEVLQIGRTEQTWNAQDLSNLAWAYGRLRTCSTLSQQDLAALSSISAAALQLGLHKFRPQGLSNLLWAHAHLGVPCSALSEAICEEAAARQLYGFSSQELSNLAWAATVSDGTMRQSLCEAILVWLQTSALERPQELSITLWAFAKTQAGCADLVTYTRRRMESKPAWLAAFSHQALSNLVWSLAKLHKLHGESHDTQLALAQVLCEVERRTLHPFKAQEISQMLHALATFGGRLGGRGDALLHAFEDLVMQHGLTHFEEKHLACIAWVCGLRIKRSLVGREAREASDKSSFALVATLPRPKPPRRIGSVEGRIERLVRGEALARGLDAFAPRHVSQLMWANALADKSSNDLLMAVRQQLLVLPNSNLSDLTQFSSEALVHVAWAFARMLGQPSQLGCDVVRLIGEELERRSLDRLDSRHVSTLLWAMARLGADSAAVFDSAHKWLAGAHLSSLSEQSLVMTLWAMASLERASPDSLQRVEDEMLRRGLERFQPQELNAAVFAFSMAKTPKGGSGRWSGRIWDAVDQEAIRRIAASALQASAPTAADSPRMNTHTSSPRGGMVEEEWDHGWGAEAGDDVACWGGTVALAGDDDDDTHLDLTRSLS